MRGERGGGERGKSTPLFFSAHTAFPPVFSPPLPVRFGGGTFHDLSDETRYALPTAGASRGVLMSEAEPGTPLARLTAVRPAAANRASQATDSFVDGGGRMLVTQINGQKVESLADFVAAASRVAPGSSGYAVARDLTSAAASPSGRATEILFNTGRYPLQAFVWDDGRLEWVREEGGKNAAAAVSAQQGAAAEDGARAVAAPAPAKGKTTSRAGRALLQAKADQEAPEAKPAAAAAATAAKPSAAALAPPLPRKPATASSGLWSDADKARFKRGTVAVRRVTDVPLDDAARGDASFSGVVVNVTDDRVVIATSSATTNSPTAYEVTFYDGSTAKV